MSLSLLDLAQLIQTTLRSLQMYTANHPRTRQTCQVLLEKFNEHFQESPTIKLAASGDRLFMDGQPGDTRSMHTTNLHKALAERNIAGIQMDKGMELDELIGMLEVLLLKPQKLDEMGGADAVIASKNMQHVRLTQTKYMEVGEDEEVASSSSVLPGESINEEGDRIKLYNQWLAKFKEGITLGLREAENNFWRPYFEGELPPANLKDTGPLAIDLKWETNSPPTVHWEAVQLALENLTAAEQLSVVTGRATIPDIPPSLNKVMDGFVPDILGKAAARLDSGGADWKGLKEAVYAAIVAKGDVSELYKSFGTHWLKSGKDSTQVSEIKNRLQWDYLPINEQLASIEKPGFMWTMAEGQRGNLIAQVLENKMRDAFHGLLEQIIFASGHGDAAFRENASRTLEIIASKIEADSVSEVDEEMLLRSLIDNFNREPETRTLAINLKCLQHVITKYVRRNEFGRATKLLAELDSYCVSEPPESQRHVLLANLRSHLCIRENIEPVIQQYFIQGNDYFDQTALPWLRTLGLHTVDFMLEMLSEEKDRRRRGQIMDSIRNYGKDILPILVKSLESDKWYLVRNTLILIAEMADDSCYSGVVKALKHPDQRVRRVAARTLWRGFGKRAVRPFLGVFEEADPETFEEILFGLAQIPASEAITVALNYAIDTTKTDHLRAMALNILVTNPSPDSLPILVDIVKRKGRIITTAEPSEIRIVAAKAMAAVGIEGKERLQEIIKSEPSGSDRDNLTRILES